MGQSPRQHAWQISSVQQLIGLSRRDIQRACYEGDGGVGILSPKDSTWGRRTYDETDLAKLFVVRQYKARGLSLPEIRREFDRAASEGEGYRELLDIQVDRLREQRDEVAGQLARAEALRDATDRDADPEKLRRLVLRLAEARALELEPGPRHLDARSNAPKRLVNVLPSLALCMEKHMAPSSAAVQEAVRSATTDDDIRAFPELLEAPGLDLALELWLGTGMFEYACNAIGGDAHGEER